MKFSTKRITKTYKAGDEVRVSITEIKENANGHINMKLHIFDGEQVSTTFFYQTIGDPMGKGRYYLEQFLDAVGVPEDLEIDDLNYFKKKSFRCILGENEWNGRTNLTVATYIDSDGEEDTNLNSSILASLPDALDSDEDFSKPKGKRKKATKKKEDPTVAEDYESLLSLPENE